MWQALIRLVAKSTSRSKQLQCQAANETCWDNLLALKTRAIELPMFVVLGPCLGGHVQTSACNWCWAQEGSGTSGYRTQAWLEADQMESMGQHHARNLSHCLAVQSWAPWPIHQYGGRLYISLIRLIAPVLWGIAPHCFPETTQQTCRKENYETSGMHLSLPLRAVWCTSCPRPNEDAAYFSSLSLDTRFVFKVFTLFYYLCI